MFTIKRFSPEFSKEWDDFVKEAKNTSFLFYRSYMDYHSDRFIDFSLLFYLKNRLYAILPANISEDILHTHQGLTYGGLLMNNHTTVEKTLVIFSELNEYLRERGIKKVSYKSIPHIYHLQPAEEDLYALWNMKNIVLAGRDVGTVIDNADALNWYRIRERGVKRANIANIRVERGKNLCAFWKILCHNLKERYNVKPVHSLEEIELLHNRFPENIHHYIAKQANEVLAGVVLYITPNVVHVQYIATNAHGKKQGALDLLFYKLITEEYKHIRYFDFGRSTENDGKYLNRTLIYQKEGFGGRAICWDRYEWDL